MAVQQVWPSVYFYFTDVANVLVFFFLQAAAVAARLAQSVGNTVTEDVKLPDKIAAAFAGRTGSDDQFSRLQNESGCKLAMSRDQGWLWYFIFHFEMIY